MVERKRSLKAGDIIDAPGAPRGYTYGAALVCPKCKHRSIVYRPRRKVWVCYYKDSYDLKCGFEMMVYASPARVFNIEGRNSDKFSGLDGDICRDLISDILGADLAASHSQEICGSVAGSDVRRSGKSSLSSFNNEKLERYRRKYISNT